MSHSTFRWLFNDLSGEDLTKFIVQFTYNKFDHEIQERIFRNHSRQSLGRSISVVGSETEILKKGIAR